MNQRDPVIDEVRSVRHRISTRFRHDPVRLVAYYIKLQEQYRGRLVVTDEAFGTSEHSRPTNKVRSRKRSAAAI